MGVFLASLGACVFITTAPATAAAVVPPGMHLFTDVQGNTAPAQVISLVGDTANLQRTDGKDWSAPLASFVPADQIFIVETLIQQRLARNNPVFSINAIPIRANENSHVIGSGVSQTWSEFYKITLKNDTSMKLANLRVRAVVFKAPLVPDISNGYNLALDLRAQTYLVDDIADHATKIVGTDPLDMRSLQSRDGYFPAAPSAHSMADRLVAIWVRVYDANNFLIQEWCSSAEVLKQGKWDDTWAKGGGPATSVAVPAAGRAGARGTAARGRAG